MRSLRISNIVSLPKPELTFTVFGANKIGIAESILRRFLSKIHYKPVGCWYWLASTFPTGYGQFQLGRDVNGKQRNVYAHRLAYELVNGPLGKLSCLHKCDVTLCVRPDHLYAGTQYDNMQDRMRAGRYSGERPRAWKIRPDLRRHIIATCLASPKPYKTAAALAQEHGLSVNVLKATVYRARQREFLANTTGAAAAVR